jgi:large repetitive protein
MSKAYRTAIPTALVVAGLLLGTAGEAAAELQQPSAPASSAAPRYAPGELVVRYRPGTSRADRAALRTGLDASVESKSVLKGLQVLDLPEGTTVRNAVEAARSLPQVLYAEPNYSYQVTASPNDPMFRDMWSLGLQNDQGINSGIDTPRAWNLTTGSPSVTVAVVDTGVETSHPDLAENIWSNPGEIAGNGRDDDANGRVDDAVGWDWVQDDNSPGDEMGHGTHVAGVIGARGNNGLGVTGVAWDVRLMPLRVLDASGSGWTSDVADAFAYAGEMGVDVVNASLAGPSFSEAMLDAMAASPETLFVVAAGNTSANVDLNPTYPCAYSLPNLICVAATGQSDQLSSYSNYGSGTVDLAAPGDRILSTWPGGAYSEMWGTSAATPHAAGVAALLAARHPEATMGAVRDAIVGGTQGLPGLAGRTVSGGRLSAAGALERMGDVVPEEAPDEGDRRCESKRRKRHGKAKRHDRRPRPRHACGGRGR